MVLEKISYFVMRQMLVPRAFSARTNVEIGQKAGNTGGKSLARGTTLTTPLVMRIFWQTTGWNVASSLGSRISSRQRLPFAFTAY